MGVCKLLAHCSLSAYCLTIAYILSAHPLHTTFSSPAYCQLIVCILPAGHLFTTSPCLHAIFILSADRLLIVCSLHANRYNHMGTLHHSTGTSRDSCPSVLLCHLSPLSKALVQRSKEGLPQPSSSTSRYVSYPLPARLKDPVRKLFSVDSQQTKDIVAAGCILAGAEPPPAYSRRLYNQTMTSMIIFIVILIVKYYCSYFYPLQDYRAHIGGGPAASLFSEDANRRHLMRAEISRASAL